MSEPEEAETGPLYQCVRCGTKSPLSKWQYVKGGRFRCPVCSYAVAKKLRPPVVKKVKAI